jgi:mono/diheme cytochrome c family protein
LIAIMGHLRIAIACLAAGFAVACAARTVRVPAAAPAPAARAVTYWQVHAILRDNCEHCHNEDKAKGGLLTGSYAALLAGGEHGEAVVPGQSASSRLVQMIEGSRKPRMPYKEDALARADVDLIRRWIDAGAPAPGANETEPPREFSVPDVKPAVPAAGAVAAVAFDPASRRLAVGSYKSVHLMSLADRAWGATLAGHADLVRALAFSPDGRRLAVAGGPSGRFGEIKIWDVQAAAPALLTTIQGHTDTILAIAFSPDGATIASAGYDKLVKVWDVTTGALISTLKEHSDAVYAVAYMSGGKQIVSAAGDRTLKVWDVSTARRLFTMTDALDSLYAVAVHPSEPRIAAAGADRMIRTWAGDTGNLVAATFAHADAVLRLAYSPDGSTLVSAGADRVIKVWDARTLRETQRLEAQPDWVMGLALSADGRWLASGRYDGTLGLYALAREVSGEQFVVPR